MIPEKRGASQRGRTLSVPLAPDRYVAPVQRARLQSWPAIILLLTNTTTIPWHTTNLRWTTRACHTLPQPRDSLTATTTMISPSLPRSLVSRVSLDIPLDSSSCSVSSFSGRRPISWAVYVSSLAVVDSRVDKYVHRAFSPTSRMRNLSS